MGGRVQVDTTLETAPQESATLLFGFLVGLEQVSVTS